MANAPADIERGPSPLAGDQRSIPEAELTGNVVGDANYATGHVRNRRDCVSD